MSNDIQFTTSLKDELNRYKFTFEGSTASRVNFLNTLNDLPNIHVDEKLLWTNTIFFKFKLENGKLRVVENTYRYEYSHFNLNKEFNKAHIRAKILNDLIEYHKNDNKVKFHDGTSFSLRVSDDQVYLTDGQKYVTNPDKYVYFDNKNRTKILAKHVTKTDVKVFSGIKTLNDYHAIQRKQQFGPINVGNNYRIYNPSKNINLQFLDVYGGGSHNNKLPKRPSDNFLKEITNSTIYVNKLFIHNDDYYVHIFLTKNNYWNNYYIHYDGLVDIILNSNLIKREPADSTAFDCGSDTITFSDNTTVTLPWTWDNNTTFIVSGNDPASNFNSKESYICTKAMKGYACECDGKCNL